MWEWLQYPKVEQNGKYQLLYAADDVVSAGSEEVKDAENNCKIMILVSDREGLPQWVTN